MVRDTLHYSITNGKSGTVVKALARRKASILPFSSLDRSGLEYGVIERRLLLKTTSNGERIYIQYPGKETKSSDQNKIRPWDFRPKVFYGVDNTPMKDLSFPDIWDDLSELNAKEDVLSILAATFYRMAYMLDHKLIRGQFKYEDVDVNTGEIVNHGLLDFEFFSPCFDEELIDYLNNNIGDIRGVSVEAYLFFNDLLVQNEDCKYFYRDEHVSKIEWKGKAGRTNTMLSHLSVIEFIQGRITFSQIMGRFQRGMGVGPIPIREIPEVTNYIIEK